MKIYLVLYITATLQFLGTGFASPVDSLTERVEAKLGCYLQSVAATFPASQYCLTDVLDGKTVAVFHGASARTVCLFRSVRSEPSY